MKRVWISGLLVAAVAIAVAGCGSNSSSSGSSSSSSTTEASKGGGGGMSVAEAQAALKGYEERPTSIGNVPPVGKPIPTGKKISFIDCGVPICAAEGEVLEEAAGILGWSVETLHTNGTPEQVQNAWTQILRGEPDGIVYAGTARAEIQQYLTQAEERGIPVATSATVEPNGTPAIGKGIGYDIGANEGESQAPVWASIINVATEGSGEAVFVYIPGFPVLEVTKSETEKALSESCPECKLDSLQIPIEQLGANTPTLIVSYLRSHPEVKVVVLSANDALGEGLPAALQAAGLDDVQVTGAGPSLTELQYIKSGQQASSIAFPLYEYQYAMMDYLAREITGVKTLPASTPPTWLLTKENIPTTSEYLPTVENVAATYEKAWGK